MTRHQKIAIIKEISPYVGSDYEAAEFMCLNNQRAIKWLVDKHHLPRYDRPGKSYAYKKDELIVCAERIGNGDIVLPANYNKEPE